MSSDLECESIAGPKKTSKIIRVTNLKLTNVNLLWYMDDLEQHIDERVLKYGELQMKEREVQAIKEIKKRLKEREIQQQESLSTNGISLDASLVIDGTTLDASLVTERATLEASLVNKAISLDASLVDKLFQSNSSGNSRMKATVQGMKTKVMTMKVAVQGMMQMLILGLHMTVT
ncbi:hypothetical protein Tco_0577916 [Tanacetum coccineum]